MKKTLILIAVGLLAGVAAFATLPTFKTFSAGGTHAAPAQINIPADPNSEIRIVNLQWTSDTNNATITFTTATTAFYQTASNALSSSITNAINSTNGLAPSAVLILQHGGICYPAVLSSWNCTTNAAAAGGAVTNIVLASGGWGVSATAGDDIFLMGQSQVIIPATASTGAYNGEALYCGNYGRPVTALLSPALVTNQLNSVNLHYDSQSQ